MKSSILLILLSLGLTFHLSAQCPQQEIELLSQQAVDDFRDNYPGCDTITTPLTIYGSDITSLQELNGLTSVGQLNILRTPNLHTLAGLESLNDVLTLTIELTGLTNMEGLAGLETVNWFLRISNNLHLTDLTGLSGLRHVDHLSIYNNAQLISLHGLDSVTALDVLDVSENPLLTDLTGIPLLEEIRSLYVAHNNSLQDLSGLEPLAGPMEDLQIVYNPLLVSIDALQQIESCEDIEISGNQSLTSLAGMGSLEMVTGNFILTGNEGLINLEGLNALESIQGNLEITENANLESILALGLLRTIGGQLSINNNNELGNLHGIDLVDAFDNVIITFNDQLSICSVQSICEHLIAGKPATIGGNFDGCSTLSQVLAGCTVANDDIAASHMLIYPNPVIDVLYIDRPEGAVFGIEIYNAQGMACPFVELTDQRMDISHLPGGIYFVSIQTDSGVDIIQLVKQ